MSPGTALRSFNEFVSFLQLNNFTRAEVSFYGGEPLLNLPVINEILEQIAYLKRIGNIHILPIINTNGTLLTPEYAQKLSDRNARIHISMDGPTEKSNRNRVDHQGRSTLARTLTGIDCLRNAGCIFQINSLITENNLSYVEDLIDLACTNNCHSIFLALADQVYNSDVDIHAIAEQLIRASLFAKKNGLELTGPWECGTSSKINGSWPPLHFIVNTDGYAHFPHLPGHPRKSVQDLCLCGDQLRKFWDDQTIVCENCSIRNNCNGYLRMMVNYHISEKADPSAFENECKLAKKFEALIRDEKCQFWFLSVDTEVIPVTRNEFKVSNKVIADSTILVSSDVLKILSFFKKPVSFRELEIHFSAKNLFDVFSLLRNKHILVRPEHDTDELLLQAISKSVRNVGKLLIGSRKQQSIDKFFGLLPFVNKSIEHLPYQLLKGTSRFCIYLARDEREMDEKLHIIYNSRAFEWMAGTVAHSVIIFNLQKFENILFTGGASRIELFGKNIEHEFIHVGLRKSGIRIPIWFEEGICEFISRGDVSLNDMSSVHDKINKFISFAVSCCDSSDKSLTPSASLLSFSDAPVDENPGYILARSFVSYLHKLVNIDDLLEHLRNVSITSYFCPFPLLPKAKEPLNRSLKTVFEHWRADVRNQLSSIKPLTRPLRAIFNKKGVLVYNRLTGGYILIKDDPYKELHRLKNKNFEVKDLLSIMPDSYKNTPIIRKWDSGLFEPSKGFHLRLSLNDGCNMKCSYCYKPRQSFHSMSKSVARKAIGLWKDHLLPKDYQYSTIRLFGGEPFLNWDCMEYILKTATTGIPPGKIKWLINTNGTLITPFQISFLEKIKPLTIVLSIDGVGKTHDSARMFKNGKGTFNSIDKVFQRLSSSGIDLCVSATIGNHNLDDLQALANYVLAVKQKYNSSVSLALETDLTARILPKKLESRFFDVYNHCRKKGLPLFSKLLRGIEGISDPGLATPYYCSAISNELSVNSEGALIVCHAIDDPPYAWVQDIKNISDLRFPEIYKKRSIGGIIGCEDCEIEGLCKGGCLAQSLLTHHNPLCKPSSYYCSMMKRIFKKTVENKFFSIENQENA